MLVTNVALALTASVPVTNSTTGALNVEGATVTESDAVPVSAMIELKSWTALVESVLVADSEMEPTNTTKAVA